MTWYDLRNPGPADLYAQRLDGAGNPVWANNGIVVCNDPYNQFFPRIINDARGGSIIAWEDRRNGASNADIYALRIENELGYPGFPNPVITSVKDVPADQGGQVTVQWTPGDGSFAYFDLYRALLPATAEAESGMSSAVTDKDGHEIAPLAGCSNGYLWQYMTTVVSNGGFFCTLPTCPRLPTPRALPRRSITSWSLATLPAVTIFRRAWRRVTLLTTSHRRHRSSPRSATAGRSTSPSRVRPATSALSQYIGRRVPACQQRLHT